LTIPAAAVTRRPSGNVVYIAKNDRAIETSVTLGRQTDDWIEILGGLEVNDIIVLDGAKFVSGGSAILVSD
jgi:membrane fusion protein (multidrug efflux system)